MQSKRDEFICHVGKYNHNELYIGTSYFAVKVIKYSDHFYLFTSELIYLEYFKNILKSIQYSIANLNSIQACSLLAECMQARGIYRAVHAEWKRRFFCTNVVVKLTNGFCLYFWCAILLFKLKM